MSSSNPSDPRLLLPEWLRDGDTPAVAQVEVEKAGSEPVAEAVRIETVSVSEPVVIEPFSERLSLDTRLDPGQLVSAEDLPKWLGGLERVAPGVEAQSVHAVASTAEAAIDEPEPYLGVDAPQAGVVDIQVSGWIVVAAAIGLFILLAAALRLYLS